ncbi:probable oligoribonuclease, partial [Teleopsis dalmanni]|uniref:probable oligoribonuclease n=1 Tax=Teleopsis dalmanni TaxID=139649 RepID=UPI0018CD4B53
MSITNIKKLYTLLNKRNTIKSIFHCGYSAKCETMSKDTDKATHIVWMDLEMTGLNVRHDKIMEIACLITDRNLNILSEGPCIAIKHSDDVLKNMNEWCQKHHTESGLVKKCINSNITTNEAECLILKYLQNNIPKGKCPLAGNSIYMDRSFLREHMPALDDFMHYRVIDVSTIKELARRWNNVVYNSAPEKKLAHRSLDDIKESIEELKYYKNNLF